MKGLIASMIGVGLLAAAPLAPVPVPQRSPVVAVPPWMGQWPAHPAAAHQRQQANGFETLLYGPFASKILKMLIGNVADPWFSRPKNPPRKPLW